VQLRRVGPLLIAMAMAGCGSPEVTLGPVVPIALYGRNATPLEVWLAVQPVTDALQSVGFGQQIGVACWTGRAGSQIVLLDNSPGRGPTNVIREIATVVAAAGSARQEVWVDVAADGSVTAGAGVPPWWPGGGGGC
jgi:hypothetical protein